MASAERPNLHDLLLAADWCEEYVASDTDDVAEDNAARLVLVAQWLRQNAQNQAAAEMAKLLADRSGRKITDREVKAAARAWAEERYPVPNPESRTR